LVVGGIVRRAVRFAATLTIASLVVVLMAVPALAQAAEATGDPNKPWHYWIAPVLVASFGLVLILLAIGYYMKVVRVPRR
jgi:hypothetical protein